MYSLFLDSEAGDRDELIARLHELGTLGIVEGDAHLQAFFEAEVPPEALLREFAARAPEILPADDIDWEKRNYDAWPPLEIGRSWFVIAPFRTDPTPPGRIRLEINPGMASGTGIHPCTQLCLQAMEEVLRRGFKVLDIGTGSGILARAAELLGASSVVACDIDPDSLRDARQATGALLYQGTVDAVSPGHFDLVICNVSENVARKILDLPFPTGKHIILSGFSSLPRAPSGTLLERSGWQCLLLRT
ncbi:MAG: 50S ribosomal protein L11 methyltransferase [Bryobacteraceae bacterium]|nr:50S ribosomal protein L11 methyltransferase [Bryobacteraceae bacterium]